MADLKDSVDNSVKDLQPKSRLSVSTAMLKKSITLEIAAKAKAMNERGGNVISFSAGEPDFDTPKAIREAGKKAIDLGRTKYTEATGIMELKTAIRQKFLRENNLHYDESNIIVTCGAKFALYSALRAIVSPGDEVIIPAPYWVSYPSMVQLCGGTPIFAYAKEENCFRLTLDDLKPHITEKTKVVLINTPNNPSGAVYRLSDMQEIAEYLTKKGIIIISDEIYEKLVYGNAQHISMASLVGDKYKRNIIVVNGVSKAYSMTGWRIGYAAGPRDIIARMGFFVGHTTSNPNTVAMYASVEALNGNQSEIEMMVNRFNRRRMFMVEEMNKIPNITCMAPEGAFYVLVNFKKYLGATIGGTKINTTIELVNFLIDEAGVAAVPGESFGVPGYIRFSYATSMDNIADGVEKMNRVLSDAEIS